MKNPWIGYFDRTYEQIKAKVLSKLPAELTDHTESSTPIKLVSVWSGIAEMLGYYIDNKGRETFIGTCRLYRSAVEHSRSNDFRIHSYLPSSAVLKLTLNIPTPTDFTIPVGTEFSTTDGLIFTSVEEVSILTGESTGEVPVKQQQAVSSTLVGVSTGAIDQEFDLPINIADNTASVMVGATQFFLKETLAYSLPSDTHCVQSVGKTQIPALIFGNNLNGIVPTFGESITIEYFSTSGAEGNIGAGLVTVLVTALALPVGVTTITVTNELATTGGAGIQTLESIQTNLPKQLRANDRAVTRQDYLDICNLKTGVAKTGLIHTCGSVIELYLVPEGGGLASPVLISDTEAWMDERKIIGKKINIQSAGEVHIILGITMNVSPNYQKILVIAAVKQVLQDYLSFENQDVSGTVYLSDIYQVIEAVGGVLNSQIVTMKPTPYAKPYNGTAVALSWTPLLSSVGTGTIEWKIVMIGTNTFDLLKGSVYIGTFSTGVAIVQPELTFTVTGSYTINDQWTFQTYNSYGTVNLNEPSVAVSYATDITINATGGL